MRLFLLLGTLAFLGGAAWFEKARREAQLGSEFSLSPPVFDAGAGRSLVELIDSPEVISCEDLAVQFCRTLWSPPHRGSMSYFGEEFYLGNSRNSFYSFAARRRNEALVAAAERFPMPLRRSLRPLLESLRQVLAGEVEDDLAWKYRLDEIADRINSTFAAYKDERVFAALPSLRGRRAEDWNEMESVEVLKILEDVKGELLDALYGQHPAWLRVQRLFGVVRDDLIAVLKDLPLPPDIQEGMVRKIESVEMTLPYSDPRRLGADNGCSGDMINGFYFDQFNRITVCAGYFNSIVSESNLYWLLAHELAHAVDPDSLLFDAFKDSPIAQLSYEVALRKGEKMDCRDWEERKATAIKAKHVYRLPEGMERLSDCLVDRRSLKRASPAEIQKLNELTVEESLSDLASGHQILDLIIAERYNRGRLERNPFFLDPHFGHEGKGVFAGYRPGHFYVLSLINQEYQCPSEKAGSAVESVLGGMRSLYGAFYQQAYEIYREEYQSFARYQLARPSSEAYADWLAEKALVRFLERLPSVQERRRVMAASQVILCPPIDKETMAKDVIQVLDQYRSRAHPRDSQRRLSVYSDQIASLVRCQRSTPNQAAMRSCKM